MSQGRASRFFASIVVVGASMSGGGACSSVKPPDDAAGDAADVAPDWWSHIAADTGPGDVPWWPDISAPRDVQWWDGIAVDVQPFDSGPPPADASDTGVVDDAPDGGD